jgi:prepilin-type N-terminal cleavage/methylation domain-containing protein
MRCRRRGGFTLIELLVVISIIALMATAALFAMWGVMEEAKADRTRRQIERIDQAIQQRWDNYLTRSIPLNLPATTTPYLAAVIRQKAIRDLMRTEMPDRITDVVDDPVGLVGTLKLPVGALQRGYRRRCLLALGSKPNNPSQPNYAKWSASYEESECLYLILSSMNEEGTNAVLDFMPPSEIGDIDKDGMPEILDAWGRPIIFIRWAPGFYSDRQSQNGMVDPDPFDPLKVDPRFGDTDTTNDPFLLFPLIMSAGSDGAFDIQTDGEKNKKMADSQDDAFRYSYTDWYTGSIPSNEPRWPMTNDPYWLGGDPSYLQSKGITPLFIGTLSDSNRNGKLEYGDNIHNHLLEVK